MTERNQKQAVIHKCEWDCTRNRRVSKAFLIVRHCLEIKTVRIIMFFNRRLMTIVRRNAYKQFLADFEHLRVIFFSSEVE